MSKYSWVWKTIYSSFCNANHLHFFRLTPKSLNWTRDILHIQAFTILHIQALTIIFRLQFDTLLVFCSIPPVLIKFLLNHRISLSSLTHFYPKKLNLSKASNTNNEGSSILSIIELFEFINTSIHLSFSFQHSDL